MFNVIGIPTLEIEFDIRIKRREYNHYVCVCVYVSVYMWADGWVFVGLPIGLHRRIATHECNTMGIGCDNSKLFSRRRARLRVGLAPLRLRSETTKHETCKLLDEPQLHNAF